MVDHYGISLQQDNVPSLLLQLPDFISQLVDKIWKWVEKLIKSMLCLVILSYPHSLPSPPPTLISPPPLPPSPPGLGWLCLKIYLICYASLLNKSTYKCSSCAHQESIAGGAFTLTFHFHINSNCVWTWTWLSKDVGEETVTCELLAVAWLSSCSKLLPPITESPHGQVSTNFNQMT